jgi:hypothetical protein
MLRIPWESGVAWYTISEDSRLREFERENVY